MDRYNSSLLKYLQYISFNNNLGFDCDMSSYFYIGKVNEKEYHIPSANKILLRNHSQWYNKFTVWDVILWKEIDLDNYDSDIEKFAFTLDNDNAIDKLIYTSVIN